MTAGWLGGLSCASGSFASSERTSIRLLFESSSSEIAAGARDAHSNRTQLVDPNIEAKKLKLEGEGLGCAVRRRGDGELLAQDLEGLERLLRYRHVVGGSSGHGQDHVNRIADRGFERGVERDAGLLPQSDAGREQGTQDDGGSVLHR